MQAYDRAGLETQGTATDDSSTDLNERDVRALTQYLTVLPETGRAAGDDDLYLVVSESGSEYLVNVRQGACTCEDYEYRSEELGPAGCKHQRRVAFATGERAIPAWADRDAIDDRLGEHLAGGGSGIVVGPEPVADGGTEEIVIAGDDAEILDDRPDDCDCAPFLGSLPCWPCYRAGFEEPNPNATDDSSGEEADD